MNAKYIVFHMMCMCRGVNLNYTIITQDKSLLLKFQVTITFWWHEFWHNFDSVGRIWTMAKMEPSAALVTIMWSRNQCFNCCICCDGTQEWIQMQKWLWWRQLSVADARSWSVRCLPQFWQCIFFLWSWQPWLLQLLPSYQYIIELFLWSLTTRARV